MKVKINAFIDGRNILTSESRDAYIDDMLLWAMEFDVDMNFYKWVYIRDEVNRIKEIWAVWSIDKEDQLMLTLKWGAIKHKIK
jgi:hypothetical protein